MKRKQKEPRGSVKKKKDDVPPIGTAERKGVLRAQAVELLKHAKAEFEEQKQACTKLYIKSQRCTVWTRYADGYINRFGAEDVDIIS